jgi:ADP-ribosylglycohydrolase
MPLSFAHRASAAVLAAGAGDALGWPQEPRGGLIGGRQARERREPAALFGAWERNGGTRYLRYRDPVAAGSYSDDTQLLLAVGRACLTEDWTRHLTRVELPAWPIYQRGGGRAVLRAAKNWTRRQQPWATDSAYFDAGANGVAMRILPHVIHELGRRAATNLQDVQHRVVLDGITTHGHSRALLGATAYAAACRFALTADGTIDEGELLRSALNVPDADTAAGWLPESWWTNRSRDDFRHEWHQTIAELHDLVDIAADSLRRGSLSNVLDTLDLLGALSPKTNGAGTVSAVAAAYLAARASTRPQSALLEAAFAHSADTDTVASMTGALLGALHGDAWMGDLDTVQDAAYLRDMGARLSSGLATSASPPVRSNPTQLQRVLEGTDAVAGAFIDGREFRVRRRVVLSNRPYAMRAELELNDGQTVAVDYAHRDAPGIRPPWFSGAEGQAEPPRDLGQRSTLQIEVTAVELAALSDAAARVGKSVERFVQDSALRAVDR